MEIWKTIKGYEPYQISTWGRIKRDGNIISPYKNHKGYLKVGLCVNGESYKKRVHRLVAQTFIPNPNNYSQVDHIDGNKENNSITNLRWVDNSTNTILFKEFQKIAEDKPSNFTLYDLCSMRTKKDFDALTN